MFAKAITQTRGGSWVNVCRQAYPEIW